MNSKQRVEIALKHQEPDRVPVDFWAGREVTELLMKALAVDNRNALLDRLGVDLRYIEGSEYQGPSLAAFDDGSSKDIWGVRRKKVPVDPDSPEKGTYEHVIEHPLAMAESISDIEKYPDWPSPEWYDYSQVENKCDKYPEHTVVCGGDRLNRTAQLKPAMYLRGVEQIMTDLVLNEKLVEAIFAKLTDYYLEYNRNIFARANGKIDIFFMGDDFGTQNGLMMSVDMWRKFIRPGFAGFIQLAHKYGIKVMHHTCGGVFDLIPQFIDCGLDILQSLQPAAKGMDLAKIKREYGNHICFQGGIDIQRTMPCGTPEDVAEEVDNRIKTLSPGGGYILCTAHNMQADVPTENALALFRPHAKRYRTHVS